jgi:hypothetical protein
MFYRVTCEAAGEVRDGAADGRFVLHRHRDAQGPHLDLRLEQDGYLLGWRVDGDALDGEPWAEEKAPHPLYWLDGDRDAVREDEGTFAWQDRNPACKTVVLRGRGGARTVRFETAACLTVSVARGISAALEERNITAAQAGALIADGLRARRRAMERFCGLGRELDGEVFDETVWRRSLEGLSLDEIQTYLRAYEVRFDQKYPPAPVSRPEPLQEESESGRAEAAMAILRD